MGNVDELLDSMGPRELAAMEVELDKHASEQAAAYYFNLGKKSAREALANCEKTGDLTPELFLIKQSKGFKNLPPKVQAKIQANKKNPPGAAGGPGHGSEKMSDEIDTDLDKCSEEQLTQLEAALDTEIETKAVKEKIARYFKIGQNLAKHAGAVAGAAKAVAKKVRAPAAPATSPGLVQKLTDIVKQHPGASMGAAAGAGYLAGR